MFTVGFILQCLQTRGKQCQTLTAFNFPETHPETDHLVKKGLFLHNKNKTICAFRRKKPPLNLQIEGFNEAWI